MNRRAFTAFTGVGLALPLLPGSAEADQPKPSPALSVDQIVTRVEACYDKTTSFKASFIQRSQFFLRHDRGSVTFQRPGMMSWRYARSGNRVVSDGTRLEIYEKEDKRLYQQELPASLFPAALSFLTRQGQLRESFEFTRLGSKLMHVEGEYVLVAESRRASPVYDRLVFYVDARTYQVRRVLICDLQGSRTSFDFAASKFNSPVAQGEFAFNPPSGTRIIRVSSPR